MQCPKCGNERRPEDATCRYCGAVLTARRAGVTRSPIRVLFPIGLLVVLAGSFLTLGPLRQMGRRSESDARNVSPTRSVTPAEEPRVAATPEAASPRERNVAETPATSTPSASSQRATTRRADANPPATREPAVPSTRPTKSAATTATRANAGQAVRVGGNIKPPRKTRDVRPVYPATAVAARVQGMVMIEATIAPDGEVSDARVLRSVPLLDEAALEAVRQWAYEPTFVNGVAVPVLMTVTVNFSLK